jgi:hypothetical protein
VDVDARVDLGALVFDEDFEDGFEGDFDDGFMGLGRSRAAARRTRRASGYAAGVPTPACSAQRPPCARFFRQPSLLHTL